jgi:hypothetical protein
MSNALRVNSLELLRRPGTERDVDINTDIGALGIEDPALRARHRRPDRAAPRVADRWDRREGHHHEPDGTASAAGAQWSRATCW